MLLLIPYLKCFTDLNVIEILVFKTILYSDNCKNVNGFKYIFVDF